MKAFKITSLMAIAMVVSTVSFSQATKTEKFKVSGNCDMCKSNIEKAAKSAGASTAVWNADTKEITVKYSSASTNTAKIQKKIAGAGYDNAGAKATDESYDKLHGCCKYDRAETAKKDACCSGGEATCKEGHGDEHKDAAADCCKDGKCSKPGHDGKDCCKKSH